MRRAGRSGLLSRPRPRGIRNAAAALIAAALLLAPGPAAAHPHSFLDVGLGIVLDDSTITALEVTWLFDDADTEIAVENADQDGDGKLGDSELAALAERMARTSGQFGFHVHLFLDDKPLKTGPIADFRLALRKDRLEARFRAALTEPVDPKARRLLIGLYDESYWIQFTLDPARDITVSGALPQGCRLETFKDRRIVVYEMVGQKVHPTVTEIRCGQ